MAKKSSKATKMPSGATGKLELLGINLIESASKLGQLKKEQLPGTATQSVEMGFAINDTLAAVNVKVSLLMSYEADASKEPAVSIFASFVANFSIVEPFPDAVKLQEFLQHLGVVMLWPYWREFAQTMTTRMGLPPFPIPLVVPSAFAQKNP